MKKNRIYGDTRYTKALLKLDTEYAKDIWSNYSGDNLVCKAEQVLLQYYPKAECTCPLCGAGNKKKHNRPAVFIPTEAGYLFKCLKCMKNEGAITLYNLLLQLNKKIAHNYHEDRWINKLTPFYADKKDTFNIPDFPLEARKEYYKRIEKEQKEKNKLEYQRKHGLI